MVYSMTSIWSLYYTMMFTGEGTSLLLAVVEGNRVYLAYFCLAIVLEMVEFRVKFCVR